MKYVAEELREQVSDIYGTPHVLNADPSSTNPKQISKQILKDTIRGILNKIQIQNKYLKKLKEIL